MKTSKRLLSVIMAAFMLIGLVSVGLTAFAAEPTLQQLIDAAGNGDTVVMARHSNESSVVIENKDIILDLNGKSLGGNYGQPAITVKNSNVTIKNGQIYSYFAKVSTADMINTVADSAYSKPTIDIRSGNVSIYGLFVNGMQIRIPTTTNTYSAVPVSSAVFVNKDANLTIEKCALTGFEWGLANGYGSHITIIDGAFAGFDKGIKHEAEVVFDDTLTSRVSLKDKIDNIVPPGYSLTEKNKSVISAVVGDRVVAYVKNAVPNVETTYDDGILTVVAKADVSNVIARTACSYKWIPDTVKVGATRKSFEKVAGTDKYFAVFTGVAETAAGSVDKLDVGYRIWLGLNAEENAVINNFVSTVKGVYADLGPWLEDKYEDLVITYNDYIDVFASLYFDLDNLATETLPGGGTFGDIPELKNLMRDLYLIGGETMYNRINENEPDLPYPYEYLDENISTIVFGIEPGLPKILDEVEALKTGLEAVDFNDYAALMFFFFDHYQDIADIVALADNYGSMLVEDLNSDMASDIITALGNPEINGYVDMAEEIVGYIGEANDFIVHGLGLGEVINIIDYIDTNRASLEQDANMVFNVIENLENYFVPNVQNNWLMMYANIYEVEYQAFNPVKADIGVNGTGKVEYASEYDNGETINGTEAKYYPNTDITFTAVETTPDVEFLYWVNSDTNRIISTIPTCTISTNINTKIEAVFNDAAFGYQVAYANSSGDIEGVEFYDPAIHNDVLVTTAIPYMPRYSFVGWPRAVDDGSGNYVIPIADLNAYKSPFAGTLKTSAFDEVTDTYQNAIVPVREGSGNYIVVPKYTISGAVKITYFDGATMKQADYGLYKDVAITAAPGNFSYWVNSRDEVVSLYPTFEFKAVQDNYYAAVYDAPVIPDAVISIEAIYRDVANDQVTFYSERSSKYTVKKSGVVLTFDPTVAADNAAFVPGGANVLTGTAKYNTLTGSYAVTKNSYKGEPIYARGYIEIEYPSGLRVTLYSDVVSFWD